MAIVSRIRAFMGAPFVVAGTVCMWLGMHIGGERVADALTKAILKAAIRIVQERSSGRTL